MIGGGAAGIAATQRLYQAGVDCLLIEARDVSAAAPTRRMPRGHAIDLGCGWLHSADRNPWVAIAQAQGRSIDKTPPPWAQRPSLPHGFPIEEQREFIDALECLFRAPARRRKEPRPAGFGCARARQPMERLDRRDQ